jgi:hypothetical protein
MGLVSALMARKKGPRYGLDFVNSWNFDFFFEQYFGLGKKKFPQRNSLFMATRPS